MTEAEALSLLSARGGYDWLVNGPETFDTTAFMEGMRQAGIPVSKPTVLQWFRQLPHTQDFGKVGVYATRADLLLFLAGRFVSQSKVVGEDE